MCIARIVQTPGHVQDDQSFELCFSIHPPHCKGVWKNKAQNLLNYSQPTASSCSSREHSWLLRNKLILICVDTHLACVGDIRIDFFTSFYLRYLQAACEMIT